MPQMSLTRQINELFSNKVNTKAIKKLLNARALTPKEQLLLYNKIQAHLLHSAQEEVLIKFADHQLVSQEMQKIFITTLKNYRWEYQYTMAEALVFNPNSTEDTLKSIAKMSTMQAMHYHIVDHGAIVTFAHWPLNFILNVSEYRTNTKLAVAKKRIVEIEAELGGNQKVLFNSFCKDYTGSVAELLKLTKEYDGLEAFSVKTAVKLWNMENNTLSCEEVLMAAKALE